MRLSAIWKAAWTVLLDSDVLKIAGDGLLNIRGIIWSVLAWMVVCSVEDGTSSTVRVCVRVYNFSLWNVASGCSFGR